MRHTYNLLIIIGLFFPFLMVSGQLKNPNDEKMEWFQDAKLGIFIHWGIYSVNGISESWSFFNNYINHENYMKQLDGFSASNYHPEKWVELIESSGAKYAVITTRHHDGVSLWDSKAKQAITIKNDAKAQKDVLTPFVESLKKSGLKTGFYYSLPDWSHPLYDINTRTKKRYEIADDPERWDDYIRYYQTQLDELSAIYHPDLLWFDGDWEHSSEEWKAEQTLAQLRNHNPDIIINSRLNHHGDYATPEQGIPVETPESKYWELCYTMNDSWGYQPFDRKYKSSNMIIRTLVDCISMGGNLLLDIGPKEDGTIPEEQIEILKNLGKWTSIHGEAIYGTRKGLNFQNFKGKSALSKDQKTLFLYLDEIKYFSNLFGIISTPIKIEQIGNKSAKITFEKNGNRLKIIHENLEFDKDVTVLKILFDEPIQVEKELSFPILSLSKYLERKDTKEAIFDLIHQIELGSNPTLNSGLTADGVDMKIPKTKADNPEIFNWISKHSEALFQTENTLPDGHFNGMSTLSKDRQTLYLFVEGTPTGPIALKGLKNGISRVRIVGEGSIIPFEIYNKLYWSSVPGIVYIDVPKERLDKQMTVIALLLDGPISLHREKIGAIESNL